MVRCAPLPPSLPHHRWPPLPTPLTVCLSSCATLPHTTDDVNANTQNKSSTIQFACTTWASVTIHNKAVKLPLSLLCCCSPLPAFPERLHLYSCRQRPFHLCSQSYSFFTSLFFDNFVPRRPLQPYIQVCCVLGDVHNACTALGHHIYRRFQWHSWPDAKHSADI